MNSLIQSVLEKIQVQHLEPLPRWRFVIKRWAVWLLLLISAVLAAIFLSSSLGNLLRTDWALAPRWPGGPLDFVRDSVRFFWIFGALVLLLGAFLFSRMTRHGYRYGVAFLTLALAITCGLMVGVLHRTSLPSLLDQWYLQGMPYHIQVSDFQDPDEGRLMGEFMNVGSGAAEFQDVEGKYWEVWLRDDQEVHADDVVQLFGEVVDESLFYALSIRSVPPYFFVHGLSDDQRTH